MKCFSCEKKEQAYVSGLCKACNDIARAETPEELQQLLKEQKMENKFTCFHNVRISIPADAPQEAYTKLCNALATIPGVDWETNTYTTEACEEERDTSEVMPKPRCAVGECTGSRKDYQGEDYSPCTECGHPVDMRG